MRDNKVTNILPEGPLSKNAAAAAWQVLLRSQKFIQVRATLSVNKRLEGKCEISPFTLSKTYQKFLHEREVGKEVTMRPGRAPHLQ